MGYNYLVIGGAGRVGQVIAFHLLTQDDTDNVTIADLDYERAAAVRDELSKLFKLKGTPHALELNVAEASDSILKQAIGSFDVVISAVPAPLNPRIAHAAIEAGTHYTDLGGVIETTREIKAYEYGAKKFGVSVIPDKGFMPGLGNVQLQRLIDLFHSDVPLVAMIAAGAVPLIPESPSNYQGAFSMAGLKHFCYGKTPVLINGDVQFVDPFKQVIAFDTPVQLRAICPEFETMEAFVTSGASLAPWDLQSRGVTDFAELTLRWPGFVDYVSDIPEEKFEEVMGQLPTTDARHPDIVYMSVLLEELESHKPRKASYTLMERFDPETGFSALERTTAFPAAIMAQFQARGRIEAGVWTPDTVMDQGTRQSYLDEVRRYVPFTFWANHEEI